MRREIAATFDGQEVVVAVETSADGGWLISIDGQPARAVDAVEVRPGTWSILCDGRSLVVDLDPRNQGGAVLHAGVESRVELVDARRARLAQATSGGARKAASGEVVLAPIAGKVVKLLVTVGDAVAPGQGVAVLEAMKMENEIRADRGGTVSAVHARAGESIEAQGPILTLE
jgi:biotin carboxyl carrier protein